MSDEKSPMVTTTSRRRNGDDTYSSINALASLESDTDRLEDNDENNGNAGHLVIDIEEAIDRLGAGRFQFQVIVACGLCFASDAMEILLLSYLTLVLQSEWDLSEGQADLIVSVVFLGALMGTFVLAPLGDKLGRRVIFAIVATTISFFGVLTALCTTYHQILMVRFMVGFGVGGLTVPYDALGELMPSSRRGSKMLATSYFWTAGSLLVPLFAWLTLRDNSEDNHSSNTSPEFGSWRAFAMLCALPSVVSTVLGVFFVPESPRWLLTRGEHEKSLRILRQAAEKNGKDPLLVFPENVKLVDHNFEKNESSISIEVNAESAIRRDDISTMNESGKENEKFPTNKRGMICSNPQWRKISLLLGGQWFGLAVMYYGAILAVSIVFFNVQNDDSGNDDAEEISNFDYGAIFITSSAETVGLTLAILVVDRIGRVNTQIWGYLLGGFCLLLMGILDASINDDLNEKALQRPYLILFAFLSRMFMMGATSVTWLHTAELLPTRFRATGHGLANAMGRVGGILCPFIVSKGDSVASLRRIGLTMFSISVVTSIIIKHLPETTGKGLGNIDVSSTRREERQTRLPMSSVQNGVSRNNTTVSSLGEEEEDNTEMRKTTTGEFFYGKGLIDEDCDESMISSFEIV